MVKEVELMAGLCYLAELLWLTCVVSTLTSLLLRCCYCQLYLSTLSLPLKMITNNGFDMIFTLAQTVREPVCDIFYR